MRIDAARSSVPNTHSARQAHASEMLCRIGEPLMLSNRVALLKDGPAAFASMFEAIAQARDHINIESYTMDAGGPGEELARLMVQRFWAPLHAGRSLHDDVRRTRLVDAERWARRSAGLRFKESMARRFEYLL